MPDILARKGKNTITLCAYTEEARYLMSRLFNGGEEQGSVMVLRIERTERVQDFLRYAGQLGLTSESNL